MIEVLKQKKSISLMLLVKYITFFALFYLFSIAGIKNSLFPFAFGFFISLIWCNQNIFTLSPMYIIASYLANPSLESVVIASFCVLLIMCLFLFHKQIKKQITKPLLIVYAILSQTMFLFYNFTSPSFILTALINLTVGIFFMMACLTLFKVLLVRGVSLKLSLDETICACAFMLAVSVGLAGINPFGISLLKIFAVLTILIATTVYSGMHAILLGGVLGLGYALNSGNMLLVAGFCMLAISSLAFKSTNKYFSVISLILTDVVIGMYFNVYGDYNIYSLIATCVGAGIFLLINKSNLNILKTLFGGTSQQIATRNLVNRSRDIFCKRLYNISEIFEEMDKVFRSLVKGILPVNEAKNLLRQEVIQKVCGDCPEKHRCLRVLSDETNKVFDEIISAGFERGKTTILDIPPFLSTRCNRVNTIITSINQLLDGYKQYATMVNNLDSSRILIAEQLAGVSKLMRALAEETKINVTFDVSKEEKIIEELNYANIVATEVILYEHDLMTTSATIVARNKDILNPNFEKIVSANCKTKMNLIQTEPSNATGFSVATFKTAPKFDVVFGSSGCPKLGNKVSGDTYSFLKLTDDKFLLAICDGMGSGDYAQKTSDTAISLIENFYKAGFDNEMILSSVNRFLSLNNEEIYSALDICVLDLKNSLADFIKVGAPEGFIKHKDTVETLPSGALPLGILEEMKPTIVKKLLENSDTLILCSDGVINCFESIDSFNLFLNSLKSTNPQTLSEQILEQALLHCKNQPNDDCTVICARVFTRI